MAGQADRRVGHGGSQAVEDGDGTSAMSDQMIRDLSGFVQWQSLPHSRWAHQPPTPEEPTNAAEAPRRHTVRR